MKHLLVAIVLGFAVTGNTQAAIDTREFHDDAQRQRAMITGLALRLAYSVSGATAELLSRTALRRDDGRVTLLLPPGERAMHGEAVQRRLDALGRALGLATEVSDFDIRRRTG